MAEDMLKKYDNMDELYAPLAYVQEFNRKLEDLEKRMLEIEEESSGEEYDS